ncbi:MAG: CDP-diacylglycerol--glycerol-3-phosphate 3-phosphatidyltransferase [Legionellales bacterium]|nr:CDP-diacylglycerol--glycerol-3-phosphate 3-phosphatidyltransferase [Legionellales bacterium]|tara:strand:- start:984 stop:1523 length:540 start_codon:yes stop_codon:yes gene_type:complete
MTLPNMLTISRLLLIPVLVVAFYLPYKWAHLLTAGIFLIASITDWVDGYLARKLNQTSRFGAFLDPVADKLIVCTSLILLLAKHNSIWFTIPVLIIVCREIAVSALREWMAELGRRARVKVSFIGKLKTAVQMLAIFILLLTPDWYGLPWTTIGLVGVYLAAFLTLLSMMQYLRAAIEE